ncbi:hypothetical protein NP493_1029g00019 [Ridgeia piscesae]|uniref:Uncharacterized protein n=1 Tax=Ridgeia piscesae TaxID=27915 RepID=A0AAD9KIF9_RIDPI|nr:hypothetical protein NP493_1029g00019 [Ridgeia piscesae]
MGTFYLGPETPRPFSVLSEGYIRRQIKLPKLPEDARYSFGPLYEQRMYELIHQYLEMGTDDCVCYVGEEKGSMTQLLQHKFCLVRPVVSVVPGHFHYEESPNHRMLPLKVANVGAEEYFSDQAAKPPQFDKVLLKDAVVFIDNPRETYTNIMKTLKRYGKLLIIHRPAPMNTLPIFREARQRLSENDKAYMSIITDLQACNLDVQWDIECLPIVMPKLRWLAMLRDRFPPQLNLVSDFEVIAGIRELSEGVLKYEGDLVEFVDRLLFITASSTVFSEYPTIQRFGNSALRPFAGLEDLQYKMPVTPDLAQYLRKSDRTTSTDKQKLALIG